MCRSRWLHLVVFVSALAHGGCGAGGGTLTGAGGNTGTGTGAGGMANVPGMNCAEVPAPARPLPPAIVIALDASTSMNDDLTNMACAGGCGQSSKWAAAVTAINSVAASTGNRVDWGLALFGCGTYTGIYVDTLPDSVGLIDMALRGQTTPNGGVVSAGTRQTRGAVNAAHSHFAARGAPGSKFIVVITDGAPMCAADGTTVSDDTDATVDAISAAATAGIPTFVDGIGTSGGPADSSIVRMAYAGRDGATGILGSSASTANDIAGALRWVADRTAGCTFEVPEGSADGTLNRSSIAVRVGVNHIPHDVGRLNGWDYVDTMLTSIRLYGHACTAAKESGPESVTITFLCILD